MEENRRMKKVSDSQVEQTYVLMPRHINGSGRLFGGQLLSWIDEMAGIVARKHSEGSVVTAAIDNLIFKAGASLDDIVVLIGRITYVGHTSMEVRVDTYVENRRGMRQMINRAYLVMVATDDKESPKLIPGLILDGEGEKAEWESGMRRAQLRGIRRKEGS